jgi:hypothetical protein
VTLVLGMGRLAARFWPHKTFAFAAGLDENTDTG